MTGSICLELPTGCENPTGLAFVHKKGRSCLSLCNPTKLLNREKAIHRIFMDITTVIPGLNSARATHVGSREVTGAGCQPPKPTQHR